MCSAFLWINLWSLENCPFLVRFDLTSYPEWLIPCSWNTRTMLVLVSHGPPVQRVWRKEGAEQRKIYVGLKVVRNRAEPHTYCFKAIIFIFFAKTSELKSSVSTFAKLSSNWLVKSNRTDLPLNLVITDPPTHPHPTTPRKVEIQLEIDNTWLKDGLADIFWWLGSI